MACISPNPRRVGYIDPIHGPLDGPLYMGSHIHQQHALMWKRSAYMLGSAACLGQNTHVTSSTYRHACRIISTNPNMHADLFHISVSNLSTTHTLNANSLVTRLALTLTSQSTLPSITTT